MERGILVVFLMAIVAVTAYDAPTTVSELSKIPCENTNDCQSVIHYTGLVECSSNDHHCLCKKEDSDFWTHCTKRNLVISRTMRASSDDNVACNCTKVKGETCEDSQGRKCSCTGFTVINNVCLPIVKEIGDNCTDVKQCKIENSTENSMECSANKCQCVKNFHALEDKKGPCIKSLAFGANCTEDENKKTGACYQSITKDNKIVNVLVCSKEKGTCECKDHMNYVEGKCSGACQINPQILMLTILAIAAFLRFDKMNE